VTARLPLHRRVASLGLTTPERLALLAEASVQLFIARVELKTVPFPKLARAWGPFVPAADERAGEGLAATSEERSALARKVSDAVQRAARNVPFGAVCLPQAMAARRMLKRRHIASVMHFGAAKGSDKPIDTHAWLDAAGVKVTGYPVANGFVEIGCFVGGSPSAPKA
jgi:hypothetical protein